MKPVDIKITLEDNLRRLPLPGLKVQLWNYPTTIEDGTVKGIASVSIDGDELSIINSTDNDYNFLNVVPGLYTAVVSGNGIRTQVLSKFEKIDTGISSLSSGSDIVWKNGEVMSISAKIESLGSFGDASGLTGRILKYKPSSGIEESNLYDDGTTISTLLKIKFTKPSYNDIVEINATTSSTNIDLSLSNIFRVSLQNSTNITFSNPIVGTGYLIVLVQDAVGSRVVTFSSGFNFGGGANPTITPTANKVDVISGLCIDLSTLICDITQNH